MITQETRDPSKTEVVFLLWNVRLEDRTVPESMLEALRSWIKSWGVNVLVLTECPYPDEKGERILRSLRQDNPQWNTLLTGAGKTIQVFTSLPTEEHQYNIHVSTVQVTYDRMSFELAASFDSQKKVKNFINELQKRTHWFQLKRGAQVLALITAVHFFSPLTKNRKNKHNRFIQAIQQYKNDFSSEDQWCLMGDFNYNPFDQKFYVHNDGDPILNDFRTLHLRRAFLQSNIQNGFPNFFYNPCWNLLGDLNNQINYNFYYEVNGDRDYYFNLIDGVVLRKGLLDAFQDDKLKILDSYILKNTKQSEEQTEEIVSLLQKNGLKPDKSSYSDHLPLLSVFEF
jgi:hypothetical protein